MVVEGIRLQKMKRRPWSDGWSDFPRAIGAAVGEVVSRKEMEERESCRGVEVLALEGWENTSPGLGGKMVVESSMELSMESVLVVR